MFSLIFLIIDNDRSMIVRCKNIKKYMCVMSILFLEIKTRETYYTLKQITIHAKSNWACDINLHYLAIKISI